MTVPWSRSALEQGSFTGWIPFERLGDAHVPEAPGVYAVLQLADEAPRFRISSPAGRYRDKDSTVAPAVLQRKWVEGAEVLFIGGATVGIGGRRGLRKRLDEYRRNGEGQPGAHWDGRYVWQLEDQDRLLLAWNVTTEPASVVRTRMLHDFVQHYGRLPFANLRR